MCGHLIIHEFGETGVLHGMRLIQHAAGCVLEGHEALSMREQLLSGYWNLLQSTRWMNYWPNELREDFSEIQAAFFQDGLPPETVVKMTASEAEAASEMIIRFRDKAQSYATGQNAWDLLQDMAHSVEINEAPNAPATVEACAVG